jgi:hypothetical protein
MKYEAGSDTFVGSIAGSVAFAASSYRINPGIAERNLALSLEAQKYDQYQFEELSFRFVRSKAVTTTTGMLGLALDPNPNSATPLNLNRFNAYEIRKMDSVYSEIILRAPKEMLAGWRFVRAGPIGTDLSLYDVGRLVVAKQDEVDTSKVGFIEVNYRVKFRYFHLEPITPKPFNLSLYYLSANQGMTTNIADSVEYDTKVVDGLPCVPSAAGVFTLPKGQYKVCVGTTGKCTVETPFTMIVSIMKNGAELLPKSQVHDSASGTDRVMESLLQGYVVSDGTDLLEIEVTLIAATGTLTLQGEKCWITLESLT